MYKALVIDDEEEFRDSTVESLQYQGFEVLQASDGWEGVQIAREELPDIIVCDINMQHVDGFEVLAILRSDSLTATIPFIFLSARTTASDIRIGMNRGADDYLTKPVNPEELKEAILSRLARNGALQMQRLRGFSQRLVTVQENERHNFAVTLKDNIIDKLTDLKLTLNVVKRLPAGAQNSALEIAETLLETAMASIDRVSYALWPSILNHLGLLPALLLLFDQLYSTSQISVEFEHHGLDVITDSHKKIMLYRIIQEIMSNIEKHAAVKAVQVRLWVEQDSLYLQVEDHGVGFNIEKVLNETEKIGIISIRERAHLLNGELTIVSSVGEGTRIFGTFPLANNQADRNNHVHHVFQSSQPQPTSVQPVHENHSRVLDPLIRVAIADSNEVICWGIRSLLDKEPGFKVLGELTNWSILLQFLEDVSIDILIVSLSIPGNDTDEDIVSLLSRHFPNIRILLLSNFVEYTYAAEALKNGAHGYLLKTSSGPEILDALHALASGHQYIAKDVINSMQRGNQTAQNDVTLDTFSTLTERERQIFYRVINGETNQQIAEKLFISSRTVETHRLNMMSKLGLRGVSALLRFALDKGLMGGDA